MFELPKLPYDRTALEPYMSGKTLDYHHGKHHQAYFTKLNELVQGTKWDGKSTTQDLVQVIKESYKERETAIFNNAAQAYNHNIFFNGLKAGGGGKPSSALLSKIESAFGSYEDFVSKIKNDGVSQFGSGWVWLSQTSSKELKVDKYPNGENPLIKDETPLFVIDVWEHAYYLDFQNRRPDFITSIMENLINWESIESNLV